MVLLLIIYQTTWEVLFKGTGSRYCACVSSDSNELDARKEIYIIQIHCSRRGSISGHLV